LLEQLTGAFAARERPMVEQRDFSPSVQVEQDLSGRAAWQLQLRWFASIGILEIRLRWLAGIGVLVATWFATSMLNVPLSPWPLYAIGLCILAYNAVLWFYLGRQFEYPSRIRSSGYDYGAVLRYYWRELEQEGFSEASRFDRFIKVQTSLDWLAMILLVHFSGGVQSPLLIFFVFHLIIASVLLSRRASYLFATVASLAVGVVGILEFMGLIPHMSLGPGGDALYQNGLYVLAVLVFFSVSLYIVVFLTTSLTASLRQRDEQLLEVQQRLSAAYERIQALYKVTRTVSSTLDLGEVLGLIAQSAAADMEAKACSIMRVDESGQTVDTVATYGFSAEHLVERAIALRESGYIYETFSSGEPTVIARAADTLVQHPANLRAEGIHSLLCVPLILRGRAEGVVCVYSTRPGHFEQADAEFLSALANSGAAAIENARTYQALEAADRAKSDFVRMVTHEFRSPLSAVQSMLRLIEQGFVGPVTEKQQDLIERSQRRIALLLDLVRDLLEMAAGKMEMLAGERTEVNLGAVIVKIADSMQGSVAEKGLDFAVEIRDEPLSLVGFEDGLERLVMNLVSNAIKYTPSGGVVSIRAWREDGWIELEVADSGIGIPEEALPRIFSEFYRAKNARALEVEGTGLGLVIAKDVVEEHGGRMSVQSTVGEGSTFHVTLPRGQRGPAA
jgi:signal transduction histidine kinase